MKTIPLTKGQFALVDDADFDWLSHWAWYAYKAPNTFYACRTIKVEGKKRCIWMHRLINDTPRGLLTDHENGDGLDNQRANLRSATHQENMVNNTRHRRLHMPRGVSWHITKKRYYAQITFNRRNIFVGSFMSAEDASVAYLAKRAELRAGQLIKE